ncbi:uncharacterized protein LOC107428617 [Ziziphus jujuba]|uniref:Uncharacterized protein LOC107428617 n=1 Tax=Ziziphus jujuba TaxID=326968 RepID=A0A6P4AGH3_ZIZJJ|nr:uncharacterized protein LOC107428617 [Ziziphus jujuba]
MLQNQALLLSLSHFAFFFSSSSLSLSLSACSSSTAPLAMEDLPEFGRQSLKQVHDNLYRNIILDPLCLKFIDTPQFQRLRDLKQLGLTYMVYPGAVHSRFEHSLGVQWLAGEAITKLAGFQEMELDIKRKDIQAVKLAGLLHNVGYGPFGHLFEHEVLPKILNGNNWSCEDMTVKMIDYIVDENNIEVDPETLKKVKEMVIISNEKSAKENRFLYEIVANGRNGIDVDKFDYIVRDSRACGRGCDVQVQRLMESMRVMDDEICYRANDYLTIHNLFATHADLHRTVYSHTKVKAVEHMVVDALISADYYLGISDYVHDPAEFIQLDDTLLNLIESTPKSNIEMSKELVQRIRRRELYEFCNECSVPKDMMDHFKDVTSKDIICSQRPGDILLNEEDVVVSNVRIDLSRGKHNPLESINFFQDYESKEKFPIHDDQISNLLPSYCQDMIVRVYTKDPKWVDEVSAAFENFQQKTFGTKIQVHATSEKRKRRGDQKFKASLQ